MNWQPIDTAPKDRTKVLTYGPLKDGSGFYQEVQGYWKSGYWPVVLMHNSLEPTHWMPLPDPPKERGAK